jgi:hypothetical protein
MNNENIEKILNDLGAEELPADVLGIAEHKSRDFEKTLTQSKQPKFIVLKEYIMKTKLTKLSAAAVIMIAVLFGALEFGDSFRITGVALGQVIENVKQAEVFSYRIKAILTGFDQEETIESESLAYNSSEHGMRVDTYVDSKIAAVMYLNLEEKASITILPEAKKYIRVILSDEQIKEFQVKNNPREILAKYISFEHEKLGRNTFNGVQVEGFEVRAPMFDEGIFENYISRLWVDIETKLPVRMEVEGTASGGQTQVSVIMEKFAWDLELEPGEFEPNIHADYTLMAEVPSPDTIDETTAIKGLRGFAEITNGKYPSSLVIVTAMTEACQALEDSGRDPNDEEEVNRMMSYMINIQSACKFYSELLKDEMNAAYYGDKVTADNPELVLLRWKVSDGTYRVVFGNLTATDVNAEELVELEKTLLEQ